jgi:hypothetical protein
MPYVMQPIEITGSTTLDRETHANCVVRHNAAGGGTITLPASSGNGDVYEVVVHTTVTSSLIIAVANATDVMRGGVALSTDVAGVTMLAGSTDDTITMNGSTTGGLAGSFVRLTDYKSGFWRVEGFLTCTGTEATPFSAAVS